MAKKNLRIGLVGVGAAAQVNHIPAIQRLEGVEIVALCDRDPEKAARVAQKFGVPSRAESIRRHARRRVHRRRRSVHPELPARPDGDRGARGRQARAVRATAGAQRRRGRRHGEGREEGGSDADVRAPASLSRRRPVAAQVRREGRAGRAVLRQGRLAAPAHRVGFRRVAPHQARVRRRRGARPRLPDARSVAVDDGQPGGRVRDRQRAPAAQGRGRGQRVGVLPPHERRHADARADVGPADGEGLRVRESVRRRAARRC